MARQIIPIDKVVKCHVNSNDSSPTYESGVAYAAGTLVNYNGDSYTAIVDIEDSDTDTPLDAPEKWALTPNAFRSSGDSGLADRVDALEAFDAAIPDGYVYMGRDSVAVTAEATDTYSEALDAIALEGYGVVQNLADDEILQVSTLVISQVATLIARPVLSQNSDTFLNMVVSNTSANASGFSSLNGTLFSGSGTSTLFSFGYASGTSTFTELSNNQLNNDRTITLYYDVYKKIKSE